MCRRQQAARTAETATTDRSDGDVGFVSRAEKVLSDRGEWFVGALLLALLGEDMGIELESWMVSFFTGTGLVVVCVAGEASSEERWGGGCAV